MNTSINKTSYTLPFTLVLSLAFLAALIIYNKPKQTNPDDWLPKWKISENFHYPRRALSAVTANGYIYVLGGVNENAQYVKPVEYAKVYENGDIGTWQTTSALNIGRFYLASVVVNNAIYVLGGGSGPVGDDNYPVSSVEMATIRPDGSLSKWHIVSDMRLPRRGLKAVTFGNAIYAIGGYSGIFLKSIEHVKVNPDGTLNQWDVDAQQALVDRYIHSAAINRGTLYLLGGHVQKSDQISYGDVESSEIGTDGYLNPWFIEKSRLLTPRFIASAFTNNRYLYIAGGHNGNHRLNNVEYAPIYRDGHIGQWKNTTPLNIPRSATASVVLNNMVYVLGGIGDRQVLNSVEFAEFSDNGELGHIQYK